MKTEQSFLRMALGSCWPSPVMARACIVSWKWVLWSVTFFISVRYGARVFFEMLKTGIPEGGSGPQRKISYAIVCMAGLLLHLDSGCGCGRKGDDNGGELHPRRV